MATLEDNEVANHARNAGFSGPNVAVAVAVAIAESGSGFPPKVNPDAVNRNDTGGTQSYGAWQINSVHKELLASGNWRDPASNARMAFVVWQRQGWRAWGVVNNSKYLLYLPRGTAAAALAEGGEVIEEATPIDEIGRALKFFTDEQNWKRLFLVVAGTVMLLIVLWPMVKSSVIGKATVDTVNSVKDTVT